jgi:hypothetical protein
MSTLYVDNLRPNLASQISIPNTGLYIAGHVVQVQQAFVSATATYNNTGTSSDISGLAVSITPQSSSSKFYITCHISYSTSNNGCGNQIRLKRNGTYIARGFGVGSTADGWFGLDNNYGQANSGGLLLNASGMYIDSPSTTSTITYQVDHFGVGGTTPIHLNISQGGNLSGVSTLTVMEIAQ